MVAERDFKRVCEEAAEALRSCEGYFIERVMVSTAGDNGTVDIFLQSGSERPDAIISLAGLLSVYVSDPLDSAFVDEFKVEFIPRPMVSGHQASSGSASGLR